MWLVPDGGPEKQRRHGQSDGSRETGNPMCQEGHCGRVLLLSFKDDPERDEKQATSDDHREQRDARSLLLEERIEGTEHDDEDTNVADALAKESLCFALVDH